MDFLVFQFIPLVSCPFTLYCQEDSGSTSFTPPHHVFRHITLNLLFSRLNRLSSEVRCSNPPTIFTAFCRTSSSISMSLFYGRTQKQHSRCASPERRRGGGSPLHFLAFLCLMQPSKLGAAFATSTHCCPVVCPISTRAPVPKAALQSLSPGLYWCLGLFLSGCKTWHFPLLTRIPSAHFSRLLRPF